MRTTSGALGWYQTSGARRGAPGAALVGRGVGSSWWRIAGGEKRRSVPPQRRAGLPYGSP